MDGTKRRPTHQKVNRRYCEVFFTALKSDIFMKLYLITFTALNSLYLCLEIYKTVIRGTFGVNNSIQKKNLRVLQVYLVLMLL